MNRRKSIKQLVIATGGLITLPQWMISCGISDSGTHASSFSVAEQKILSSVADTIIPAGDAIGALSTGVDKFLQKLFDDCYDMEARETIKAQLKNLDTTARSLHQQSFDACPQAQRQEMLLKMSLTNNKTEKEFFDLVKTETIRGFTTSKSVMLDHLGYKLAPGHYHGCVDVKI